MSTLATSSDVWQRPTLDRTGQQSFWDGIPNENYALMNGTMSKTYSVISLIGGMHPDEIIFLGGAISSQLPKLMVKEAYCHSCPVDVRPALRPRIILNNLSYPQSQYMQNEVLAACKRCGVNLEFSAGPIREACIILSRNLPVRHRTLFMEICSVDAFFTANPVQGAPLSGFDQYLANSEVFGEHFWFRWVPLENDQDEVAPMLELSVGDSADQINSVRAELARQYKPTAALALQVVGVHQNRPGFFIDHWYTPMFDQFVQSVFTEGEYQIDKHAIAKGNRFVIQSKAAESHGAIAMLGNSLGHVLTSDQRPTLEVVRSLMTTTREQRVRTT